MAGELEGHFTITVPAKPQETDYDGNRSALFVEKNSLAVAGFVPSEINPHVMVTRTPEEVLDIVSANRKFGSRNDIDGFKGLENDPNRQQMIVYTFIVGGDSVLLYRRATQGEGDSRLSGNASIGFDGHTTVEDLNDIAILHELEPEKFIETQREDGSLRVGINRELEEELGLSPENVDLKVVGAFYEKYTDEEIADEGKIPVGSVHTCIIAAAQLLPEVTQITLQKEEIAEAKWVKISELPGAIEALKAQGVIVENWTDIGVAEFEDILINMDGEPRVLPRIEID